MGSWKIVNQPTDREIKFKMTTKGDEIITKISKKKKKLTVETMDMGLHMGELKLENREDCVEEKTKDKISELSLNIN